MMYSTVDDPDGSSIVKLVGTKYTWELLVDTCDLPKLAGLRIQVHSYTSKDRSQVSCHCYPAGKYRSGRVTVAKKLTGARNVEFVNGNTLDFRSANLRYVKVGRPVMQPDGSYSVMIISRDEEEYLIQFDATDLVRWESDSWLVSSRYLRSHNKVKGIRVFHREVAGATGSGVVDHIDGNPMNNRRANLRVTTQAVNAQNRTPVSSNSSGRLGVYLCKDNRAKPWYAKLVVDGATKLSEYHTTFEEAVESRKAAEEKYHPYRRKEEE